MSDDLAANAQEWIAIEETQDAALASAVNQRLNEGGLQVRLRETEDEYPFVVEVAVNQLEEALDLLADLDNDDA